jgi:hypothetical protein
MKKRSNSCTNNGKHSGIFYLCALRSLFLEVQESGDRGLLNFIDTKAKCGHKKKNLPGKRLWGRCLSGFVDERYCQSYWYFRPSFMNCCPSNLSPPPLLNKYTVYMYTLCKVGGMGFLGSWRHTDKHRRKFPLQVNFFRCRYFTLSSIWILSFYDGDHPVI